MEQNEPVVIVCIPCAQDVRVDAFILQEPDLEIARLKVLENGDSPVQVGDIVPITLIPRKPELTRWCETCNAKSDGTFCWKCGMNLEHAQFNIGDEDASYDPSVTWSVRDKALSLVMFSYQDFDMRKPLCVFAFYPERKEQLHDFEHFLAQADLPTNIQASVHTLKARVVPQNPRVSYVCPVHGPQRTAMCNACGNDLRHLLFCPDHGHQEQVQCSECERNTERILPAIIEREAVSSMPYNRKLSKPTLRLSPPSETTEDGERFEKILGQGLKPRKEPTKDD
jgi:predicted amidophosphoribosyltransferase